MELTYHFNSQPHKEADQVAEMFVDNMKDFNSQPHKEADGDTTLNDSDDGISTHSLTRRLTNQYAESAGFIPISTHSLTRRLTNAFS